MNTEKIEHHIKHLEDKHNQVDKQLTTLLSHGHYTDSEITQLKKKKLILKDQIESFKQRMAA